MQRFRWFSFLVLVGIQGIFSGLGGGAEPSRTLTVAAAQEKGGRVAIVIGNSNYPSGALANPKNDATVMAGALKKLGFDVELKLDASKMDMDAVFKRFSRKAEKADVAALFYAGHGMQVNGSNYIVPIDARPQTERDLKREMIKMDDVIDDMGGAKVKLVFFDACRDNPLSRSFSRGGSRGMAAPVEATGTLISFATKHGNTAADGDSRHSPYTAALLGALENPRGVEIEQMLRRVQQRVKLTTKGQQEPWRYGSLDGDFYFQPAVTAEGGKPQQEAVDRAVQEALQRSGDKAAVELVFWESVKNSNDVYDLKEYLTSYPQGTFAGLARIRIRTLEGVSASTFVKPLTQSVPAAAVPVLQAPIQVAMIQPSRPVSPSSPDLVYPQAGDSWTYRYVDRWRKEEPRVLVVKVAESAGGRVTDTMSLSGGEVGDERTYEGKPSYSERSLGSDARVVELLPYAQSLLQTGMDPGTEKQFPDIDMGGGSYRIKARLVGQERISVPAGTFDTVRVELVGQRLGTNIMWSGQSSVPSSFVHTLWYSLAVRRVVKVEHKSGNNWRTRLDDTVQELVSFTVSG